MLLLSSFQKVLVLVSPVLLRLVLPGDVDIALPYGRALLFIAIAMLVPLGIGLVVRLCACTWM